MSKSALNTTEQNIQITDDPVNRFYEITADGTYAGLLVYELTGPRYALTHTYIEPSFRGHGLATRLIQHVMDDLRTKGTTATNYCPVIDAFLHKHPEYSDLVDARPDGRSAAALPRQPSEMPPDLDDSGRRRIQARSGR
jgi:predicted GNAT family acetyltransferase